MKEAGIVVTELIVFSGFVTARLMKVFVPIDIALVDGRRWRRCCA